MIDIIYADSRPSDDVLTFRRRALKDVVICIGWTEIGLFICYTILYFLVHFNSNGTLNGTYIKVIEYMILAVIPFTILTGLLLCLGALKESIWTLQIGLWLCFTKAAYETAVNIMGALHFFRTGYLTVHFILAVLFAIMATSIFNAVCHHMLIIHAYIKCLRLDD